MVAIPRYYMCEAEHVTKLSTVGEDILIKTKLAGIKHNEFYFCLNRFPLNQYSCHFVSLKCKV